MPGEKDGGGDVAKTFAQIDKEAIEKYNKNLEISLEREAKLHQHWLWRGNKIAPFDIEPLPLPRPRLAGEGMTAEDRVRRRQFLMDQELSHNEPRYIAALYPKNPIRRVLAAPWNAVFGALKPIIGEGRAASGRFFIPKIVIGVSTLYVIYYHMKYNQNQWVDKQGWTISTTKPTLQPDGVEVRIKEDSDFYDKGFKHRKVLLHS